MFSRKTTLVCYCALIPFCTRAQSLGGDTTQTERAITEITVLEGEAYRKARDALLKTTTAFPYQGDGLRAVLAFIFDVRAKHPRQFELWDQITPQPGRSGISFFRSEHPEAPGLIFLLEQAWKADNPHTRSLAAKELVSWVRKGTLPKIPWQIARTLAYSAESEEMRILGYLTLGASGDPATEAPLRKLLADTSTPQRYADMVLVGLFISKPDYAASLVADTLASLSRSYQLVNSAAVLLASADGEIPRSTLHALIKDDVADSFQRLLAIEASADFPRAGDAIAVQHFLRSNAAIDLKERAILALGKYPYQEVTAVLRDILVADETHPQLINAGVFTLTRLYQVHSSPPSVENMQVDLAMLRAVSKREDISDATKAKNAGLIDRLEQMLERP